MRGTRFTSGDEIQVLEGSTFLLSDASGDINEKTIQGLFDGDTRHVSRYVLTLNGERPQLLSSRQVDYFSAAFFLTNPEIQGLPIQTVSVHRIRFIGQGLHEDVSVHNHLPQPVTCTIRLSFGVDFADLFEVGDREVSKEGTLRRDHDPEKDWLLKFHYQHDSFEAATVVSFSQQPRFEKDDAVFGLNLQPHGKWETCVEVSMHRGEIDLKPVHGHGAFGETEREASQVVAKWREEIPDLEADWDLLRHVNQRSVVDLAALRLVAEVEGNEYSLPAAGLPWFMTLFGRDTLIVSYQALLVGPELAAGALRALADYQGKEMDDFQDEEPGKILHEIRYGELTALGRTPHRPYYGSADSTPLFLVLLSEYWRLTGDDALVRELEPAARSALRWMDDFGDLDGDGYVEYRTRSSRGLRNQGWKDSEDSVLFADGTPAEPPIALCEVQGYAFDAKVRMSDVAQTVWGDEELAERLRRDAAALADRFDRDFWIEERGHYALALDGDKRQVDSLTSNTGHLLWSGIVPEKRARKVVERLFSEAMWTGWGVRTMSAEEGGYNPIAYHTGTVWPHDNSLISAGLARYGFWDEANRIAAAMFEAAEFTSYRLPEVFAGYPRGESRFPVRYPTASNPQAWATAAPFLWLRVLLGLDARDGRLVADPHIPEDHGEIRYRGIHAFGGRFDVFARGTEGRVEPA